MRIYDQRDTTTIVGADGVIRRLDGASAELLRAVLDFTTTPRTRDEIFAHLYELAGSPVEPVSVVDQLLELLQTAGVLREATTPLQHPPSPRIRLLLAVTGAAAAMQTPALVALLQRHGFDVQIATTTEALHFVQPDALETLTHHPVHTRMWSGDPAFPVPHIHLAEWAQVVLVCPATATTLSRIARGDCSDLVAAIAVATRAPVILVPSMNANMYTAPSVQRNLHQLREDGFILVHPSFGAELAHAPDARTPTYGTAPSLEDIVEIVRTVTANTTQDTVASTTPRPTDALQWDKLYATTPTERLPWFSDTIDPEVSTALDRLPAGSRRLLDLGTGPGTVAIEAARRGFIVVATDVSSRALEIARTRAGTLPVTWLLDDVLASRLMGTFDLIHDRGCLHCIPPSHRWEYIRTVARLATPGGHLLLKTHATSEPRDLGTYPLSVDQLNALFQPFFQLVHATETTFPGTIHPPPRALFCILRRRE